MTRPACVLMILAAMLLKTTAHDVHAQAPSPKYKPAFAGQTDAPPPSTPSPKFNVATITGRLSGP